MTSIKFTTVKLIIHILGLICMINILSPSESMGIQRFTVQVAASKTPTNIQQFSKRHNITVNILEIKTQYWYKYVVGNFESLNAASRYSREFTLQTGITGAFPCKLDEASGSLSLAKKAEPDTQSQTQSSHSILTDTVPVETKKTVTTVETINTVQKSVRRPSNESNYLFIRLLGVKNVYDLKNDLIIFGNKHLPLIFRKFYVRVIEKTYTYPVILLFIFLIFVFIVNVILALLVLYYSNLLKNQKDRHIRIYRNLYEEVLRSYLFGEIDWEKTFGKLKKIRNPLNREILTSVLFNFQENLRGDMDNRIPEIFVKLNLHKDARNKAKSSFYYTQIQGIRELTNLYPKGALGAVRHFINAPNDLVRAEAQTSYIRLYPDKPFEFFRTLTSPFTRWTQLSAFYLFRLHQLPVPSFVEYLDSKNPNVRNFCLNMIIFFQQVENATEIFELLNSPLEKTRYLSIKAINELRLYDGKEIIKRIYLKETEKNKLEIIRALKNIGNAGDFDFLGTIIHSDFVALKIEACRSLYFMSTESRERLFLLKQNTELEIEKYIDHVLDPRN